MIYYTDIVYELIKLLTMVEKKDIGFRLSESEKRLQRGESIIRIIFGVLVKFKPGNDAELMKHVPRHIRITNLPMQKKRIIYLILEHISTTTSRPGMVVKKLMGQIELLWEWEQIEMIPAICDAAIALSRENHFHAELVWLLHQKSRAQKSDAESHTGLSLGPEVLQEMKKSRQAEKQRADAEDLFLAAEESVSASAAAAAENLLAHPLLTRIKDIESFEGRIFAYRARLKCLKVLNRWLELNDTLVAVINALQSPEAKSFPSLHYLLPEYLTFLGTTSLHLNNKENYARALQNLDTGRRKKGKHQLAFISSYYNTLIAGYVAEGELQRATKVVDKLLAEEKVFLPKLYGYLAIYFYQAHDWESAIEYCTRHLTGGTYPYHHSMTYWMMKIVSQFELRNWKYLGHVVKDASTALGKKKLGPVEQLIFAVLMKANLKTHPSELVKQLTELSPLIATHLSSPEYQSAEVTMQLKPWLARLTQLRFTNHQ